MNSISALVDDSRCVLVYLQGTRRRAAGIDKSLQCINRFEQVPVISNSKSKACFLVKLEIRFLQIVLVYGPAAFVDLLDSPSPIWLHKSNAFHGVHAPENGIVIGM